VPHPSDPRTIALDARSQFVKRANCPRCGAPKTLPSATAYLYCDYCGALMDYDFRLANAGTNLSLTNTVFHRLMAPVQATLAQARARGDRDSYRGLYRQLYAQWVQECPMAVSPRARSDAAFRAQYIGYQVECAVVKDFDPRQAALDEQAARLAASLQRAPAPNGTWLVVGGFWPYAELFKQQIDLAYEQIHAAGVDALDPDHAPRGVDVRMEYSTFCQGWLPHLSPADGERLLKLFGLDAEYIEIKGQPTDLHRCGACGVQLHTVSGARAVVCEACGHTLDIGGGDVPCPRCGAKLSFPVSVSRVTCPYCHTEARRV
jgi:DNA-directed RNA polymerase subunit RPC12/RpoP